MKKVLNNLISSKLALILLSIFILVIGVATFVEDKYDTPTVKLLFYHSAWFEVFMLALVALYILVVYKNKLYLKEKIPQLLFHISFIVIFIGGGITRYTGYEANMHIVEKDAIDVIYTAEPFFQINTLDENVKYSSTYPLYFSQIEDNFFHLEFDINNEDKLGIDYKDYIFKAKEVLQQNVEGGEDILEVSISGTHGNKVIYLREGEIKKAGETEISFNNNIKTNTLKITYQDERLSLVPPCDIKRIKMPEMVRDTILKDSVVSLEDSYTYIIRGETIQLKKLHRNAEMRIVAETDDVKNPDALIVDVSYKGNKHEAVLFYDDTRYVQPFKQFNFDGLQLNLAYGVKPIDLPFAIELKKFTLSKYPGTSIPSASESRVTLIDDRVSLREEHIIAKNKVLDYDGYRFFQTSYDNDEKGTILSVNYDYYGTRITYFGYILMILGALMVLVSKKSGFSQINKKIKQVREKRKSLLMTILLLGLTSLGFSQSNIQNPISVEHSENFGKMIVQTYNGRFSSVHSLATDIINKISGKDIITIEGKGKMNAMQIFLDIQVDPDFWGTQKIIIIREQSLRDILGLSDKYASYSDFFDDTGQYKLERLAQIAFNKKASEQSSMEREVLKVADRVNLLYMTMGGKFLKIFPEQASNGNSINNNWISWDEPQASNPLGAELKIINEDLQLQDFTYSGIMRTYLRSTIYARESGDYAIPDKIVGYIKGIQRQMTSENLLPTESKINMEVLYNRSKIFDRLVYIYAILGVALLLLTFIKDFKIKPSKKVQLSIKIFTALFVVAFLYQTFGMGLRWYLGGHAPWSNGYEVLLLVSWGGVLAGFSVIRFSKITLASTAILASLILMIAGHSYYDPQLTNLNPVLKSYWLIVHVAIITIGYGFLALSFILGLINLFISLLKTKSKAVMAELVVAELTLINKKLVIIGMFLTVIGTYIGCVWANESWGTYWSWNAKQTWSLIIVLVYGLILHFKFFNKLKSDLIFNIGALISFGSVIMTFVGVNYYFTKGLHSYASDDPPIFPVWAWVAIVTLLVLIIAALVKENILGKKNRYEGNIPINEGV